MSMTEIAGSQLPSQLPPIAKLNVRGRSPWQEAWGRFIRNKASVAGLVIVLLFMLVTVFASVIAPHSPLQLNSGKSFLPPAWVEMSGSGKTGLPEFLLGTDTLGRDALSRVLYGSRVSMMVGFHSHAGYYSVWYAGGHGRRLLWRGVG